MFGHRLPEGLTVPIAISVEGHAFIEINFKPLFGNESYITTWDTFIVLVRLTASHPVATALTIASDSRLVQ